MTGWRVVAVVALGLRLIGSASAEERLRIQTEQPAGDKKAVLDQSCKLHRRKLIDKHPSLGEEVDVSRTEVFYSGRLETCVEARESLIRNEFRIKDISRGFVRPSLSDPILTPGLFDCGPGGVNNVLIEEVEKRGGYVFTVPYSEYMDDFAGGLPATLRTPGRRPSRQECERLFQRKLKEIR